MKQIIVFFVFAIVLSSCKSTLKTDADGWTYLFNGVDTKGWRAYNGDALPPGWTVKEGTLTFDTELGLEQDYKGGIDIIYGLEEFENFELYVEWKLPEGGNSGIFYHLKEGIPNAGPPSISPEYQLIDNANYARLHDVTEYNLSLGNTENPSDLQPSQRTASDYAMYAADPAKAVMNPFGEWNSSKIVFTPERVEHWLNGKLVLSFVPWSEDWYARKNSGKFKDAENYGRFKTGYIGFQDHSSPVWFKNIKIKKLGPL